MVVGLGYHSLAVVEDGYSSTVLPKRCKFMAVSAGKECSYRFIISSVIGEIDTKLAVHDFEIVEVTNCGSG